MSVTVREVMDETEKQALLSWAVESFDATVSVLDILADECFAKSEREESIKAMVYGRIFREASCSVRKALSLVVEEKGVID